MSGFAAQSHATDVLLVRPRTRSFYKTLGPDLGLGYLATALRRRGVGVGILDLQLLQAGGRLTDGEALAAITSARPGVVGFKLFSMDVEFVRGIAPELRRRLPGVKILAGGPHTSGDPELTMATLPEVDYGFVGEAEAGLPELAAQLLAGRVSEDRLAGIPGLVRRQNGSVRVNPQVFTEELDSLGMPAWDLMDPRRYPVDYTGSVFVPVIATRGCPFNCQYCAAHRSTGRKLRFRSPASIVAEIRHLKDRYGIRRFHIDDDNFTLNNRFAREVLREMIRAKLDLPWRAPNGLRLDTLDEEVIRLLERAGCYFIYVGVESGSQRTLDRMGRAVKLETLAEKIRLIKRCSGIKVLGFFMIGYHGDTREDVEKTIRFARLLPLDMASFFFFNPLPGTPVYEQLKAEQGRKGTGPSGGLFTQIAVFSPELPRAWLQWAKFKAYFSFYLRPRIVLGILREIRSPYQFYRFLERAAAVLLNR